MKLNTMEFLKLLFATIDGQLLYLRAEGPKGPGGTRPHRRLFVPLPLGLQAVERFVARHRDTWHIFFGCAPRARPSGEESAVEWLVTLWADIDFKQHPTRSPQEIYDATISFRPRPSVLTFSGHGLHTYWLLKRPVHVNGRREDLRRLLQRVQQSLGSDDTYPLSFLLRLPGSYNVKDPSRRKLCQVVVANLTSLHLFGDFVARTHRQDLKTPPDEFS